MKAGSTFAYESTQSIATNGANRQRAITTRTGVTTGGFTSDALGASDVSDIWRLRPLTDHLATRRKSKGQFRLMEPPSGIRKQMCAFRGDRV
ncbi:hypothetical protein GCM10010094_11610 [Streptomyces flaveus]|uniref:Uncharacterized protein n=1 Tax=Streptomyces flaveus TaxID=66370 RepID=A0A917V9Q2_9ACTN|nr:hypothetical protein GCM10010094_11610 [Streptomyces flaveus]